jgi:hypothetical protein
MRQYNFDLDKFKDDISYLNLHKQILLGIDLKDHKNFWFIEDFLSLSDTLNAVVYDKNIEELKTDDIL